MKLELLSNALADEWISFTVAKMRNTRVVWVDSAYGKQNHAATGAESSDNFLSKFSYGIIGTPCFNNINFDPEDTKNLLAERYGGAGLAHNGGGVRAGTFAPYQLKGIGANCLVAKQSDYVHSYGGLDAKNAIVETIFTHVLAKVLPLGTVTIPGLIFTGLQAASDTTTYKPCWGLIMVREACIRPAHLMAATAFKPHPDYRHQFKSDVARTRNIHKKLAASFINNNDFILFLGKYLAHCANQFGFARMARILHGTLTPSNMCIDGRWLDVCLSGFINGGVNTGFASVFYAEIEQPLTYALEILNTYAKYNGIILNPAPLIKYYREQSLWYSRFHMGFVLALPAEKLMQLAETEWNYIADIFARVIASGKKIINLKRFWGNDPAIALLMGLFISFCHRKEANAYFSRSRLNNQEIDGVVAAFRQLMLHAYSLENTDHTGIQEFLTCRLLTSLKRSILSEFYFHENVSNDIEILCSEKTPDDIAPTIDNFIAAADWIYQPEDQGEITLFNSSNLCIFYAKKYHDYRIYRTCPDGASDVLTYTNFSELFYFLSTHISADHLSIQNFSFKYFFVVLNQLIPLIENYPPAEN